MRSIESLCYNIDMNIEKLQFLAKYRWIIVLILALIFSGLSVSIFHLPILMTARVEAGPFYPI